MADIDKHLVVELRSPEFSEGYAESFLDTRVATQIKVLREQRRMTQKQLAEALRTSQTVISRIEGASYSSWNIRTLKKLARAFEVRLHISFETVGSLIDEVSSFSRKSLQRAKRSEDPILWSAEKASVTAGRSDTSFTAITAADVRNVNPIPTLAPLRGGFQHSNTAPVTNVTRGGQTVNVGAVNS